MSTLVRPYKLYSPVCRKILVKTYNAKCDATMENIKTTDTHGLRSVFVSTIFSFVMHVRKCFYRVQRARLTIYMTSYLFVFIKQNVFFNYSKIFFVRREPIDEFKNLFENFKWRFSFVVETDF